MRRIIRRCRHCREPLDVTAEVFECGDALAMAWWEGQRRASHGAWECFDCWAEIHHGRIPPATPSHMRGTSAPLEPSPWQENAVRAMEDA